MSEKLKSLIASDHTFYSLLVLLVGFGGFLLGGGSVMEKSPILEPAPAQIVETMAKAPAAASDTGPVAVAPVVEGVVVGSKTGTKYHLPSCPGASQIKPENRLEFASVAMAEAAGYKPAANCPGLVQ